MNERHDDLQEIIDAALREMAAEEGDGFDPQACNLAEFCRRTGLTRSRARTVRAHGLAGAGASPYELASDAASRLGIAVGAEELATLASDLDLGDGEMAAVAATFSYLAEKRRLASIETLLRLSRLPRREPKTFEGFDFSRI